MKQFLQAIVAGVVSGFIVGILMGYALILVLGVELSYINDDIEANKVSTETVKYELDELKEMLRYE